MTDIVCSTDSLAQLALHVDEAPDKAPGEESDETPKLENANQRFAFSLISDPLNSLHSLVVCLWSPTYRRWSAYGRLLIAYKRFGFGITDVVPVIFYD